ncbi:MAG: hypothetical protein WD972_01290 [Candidatus Andersenbacteria bacterium]
MNLKKNIPLIVGLAIPVIMVIVVAATIYLPRLANKPQTDFLYQTGGDYYTQRQYVVENGKLIKLDIPDEDLEKIPPYERARTKNVTLYRYDAQTNTNQELSLAEAQELNLDPNNESPDGFTISRGSYGGDIFSMFGGGTSQRKWYLKSDRTSFEIDLKNTSDEYWYDNGSNFVGWIID